MAQPFYLTYIGIYQRHISMSLTQIGLIGAAIAVLMLFLKPLIGAITDKASDKNRVVFVLFVISSVAILFFYFGWLLPEASMQLFLLVAFCMLCHQVFFGTAATLFEANGIELLNERQGRWNSGHVRLGGTIGFMVASLVAARVIGANNNFERMFIIFSVFCVINAIWMLRLPKVPGKAKKAERVPYHEIFKNRPFLVMLFLQFTNSIGMVFFRYFGIYLTDATVNAAGMPNGLGFDASIVGVLAFMNAILEIPIFWYAGKIRDKIGMKWFMFIAVMITALKNLLFSYIVTPMPILLITMITGFSFVGIHFCTVNFLNDQMPMKMRSTAQAFSGLVAQVLGAIVVGAVGGWLADTYSVPVMMRIGALIIAIGGIAFYILFGKAMDYHNKRYGPNMTPLDGD